MFDKGECFDLDGVILRIVEKYLDYEDSYKVEYFVYGEREEAIISEKLLCYLPTFPF